MAADFFYVLFRVLLSGHKASLQTKAESSGTEGHLACVVFIRMRNPRKKQSASMIK